MSTINQRNDDDPSNEDWSFSRPADSSSADPEPDATDTQQSTTEQATEVPHQPTPTEKGGKSKKSATEQATEVPGQPAPVSFSRRLKRIYRTVEALINQYRYQRKCPFCFKLLDIPTSTKSNPEASQLSSTCLHCRNKLPVDFFEYTTKSIAIVGGPNAGKSTYIAMLAELLTNSRTFLQDFGIHAQIINSEGRALLYSEDINSLGYVTKLKRGQLLEGTASEGKHVLLRIKNNKKRNNTLFASFYDLSGEEFATVDSILAKHPFISNADAILFLIDPLKVHNLVRSIGAQPNAKIEVDEMDSRTGAYFHNSIPYYNYDLVENIHEAFVRSQRIDAGDRFPIPVAFCISKADLMEEHEGLFIPEDRDEYILNKNHLASQFKLVSQGMIDFLKEADGNLHLNIEILFNDFIILPISPLGFDPKPNTSRPTMVSFNYLNQVNPKGVLLPFVWTLNKLKFI